MAEILVTNTEYISNVQQHHSFLHDVLSGTVLFVFHSMLDHLKVQVSFSFVFKLHFALSIE